MEKNPSFLIDANILITAYQQYYQFDIAPSYWRLVADKIMKKEILVLDAVYNEVLQGEKNKNHDPDQLSKWLSSTIPEPKRMLVSSTEKEVLGTYTGILAHIQTSGLYKESALYEWAKETTADARLIACGSTYEHTVVTTEVSQKPSGGALKYAKIPDICEQFKVECINPFEMMKRLNMKL